MRRTFAVSETVTDLPSDLSCQIGISVVLFANLEWSLSRIAYAILGVDRNMGRIAVREPRATDRFDMICELLTYREIESKTDLKLLRQSIEECQETRNLLAHAVWVKEPDYGTFRILKTAGQWQPTPAHPQKTKRKVHPEALEFEVSDAIALNAKLKSALAAIYVWAAEFSRTPPTSQ